MTASERDDLHVLVLQILREKKEIGIAEAALMNLLVKRGGYQGTLPLLQVELRALGEKIWIAPWDVDLSARRWIITTRGELKLAEAGL